MAGAGYAGDVTGAEAWEMLSREADAVPVGLRTEPEAKVRLICRSGNRSRWAAQALTVLGFERCYTVADGFEGRPDGEGRRGVIEGWQAAGLPWGQG